MNAITWFITFVLLAALAAKIAYDLAQPTGKHYSQNRIDSFQMCAPYWDKIDPQLAWLMRNWCTMPKWMTLQLYYKVMFIAWRDRVRVRIKRLWRRIAWR